MPKPKTAATAKAAEPNAEVLVLQEKSTSLIERIEQDIENVPSDQLVPFYCQADKIVKRLTALNKESIRLEMIRRRESGEKHGDEGKHRLFRTGCFQLVVETHQPMPVDPVKAEERLREKGLWDDAVETLIVEGTDRLKPFLWKHRKELREEGISVEQRLDEKKLDALVQLGKLTIDDVQYFTKKADPTYVLKPKILKK